ncbi:acyl-CoA dehydrogenase family protein [Streptomyces sp. NPDC002044]|uniref:acyl-CoA dehydrogenase family protein n=1 Tax=Streptomyces sp. NPDC002044 TaxID=3154662 RepID=UPI00331DA9DC
MYPTSVAESRLSRAARGAAELAGAQAARAEQDRSLSPEVVGAVVAAGFARHFVPRDQGGAGGTFAELAEAVPVIGAVCPSTAWCASIAAGLGRMAGFLPEEGRKEIWQDGPDTLVVGSVSPKGRARREGDGWRLSGTWPYVSLVAHSHWALVLAVAPGPGGGTERRILALPRSAYRVERTWSDIGMRATGSDTLVAEEVFVPDTLTFAVDDMMGGRPPAPAEHCHTVPLPAVNGLFFALPMLGAAQGALAHWSAYAVQRLRAQAPGAPGPGPSFYEETLARTAGETDAARLLLERAAARADAAAEVTALEAARGQRDCALAADLLVGAVERLFRASGTAGHDEGAVLQRLWRDIHSAAGHVVLQFGPSAAVYARHALNPGS